MYNFAVVLFMKESPIITRSSPSWKTPFSWLRYTKTSELSYLMHFWRFQWQEGKSIFFFVGRCKYCFTPALTYFSSTFAWIFIDILMDCCRVVLLHYFMISWSLREFSILNEKRHFTRAFVNELIQIFNSKTIFDTF